MALVELTKRLGLDTRLTAGLTRDALGLSAASLYSGTKAVAARR